MPKIKVIPLLEVIFKNKRGTSELWKAVSELLQKKEQEISVFSTYIKHKINSYDKENSLLALDLLDFCMDSGDVLLWSHIGSKEFLSSLVTNLKTRDDTDIQSKILFLIEKWGNKFSNCESELVNFQNVYMLLKRKNVSFPINMQSSYNKYVKYNTINNNFNNFNNNNNNNYINNNSNNNNNINKINQKETDPENYLRDINLDLNTSSYEKKYKKLVNKLYDWTHAIHEVNVLINKNYKGINNDKIADLVKDLSRGNKQLLETIESGKLKDETLMKISLCVTSDIDMTIQRWSKNKNGIFPNPFISSFFQNDSNINENDYQNNNNYNNNFNCKNNNQKNDDDLMNFYNVNNNTKFINKNSYGNNNNNNNNGNSFNLLIDFNCDSAPAPLQNNQNIFNNNKSMNINNKNFNNFMDFVSKTEQNQMQNQNYNNILCKSNINYNNNFNNNFNNNLNSINVSQSYNLMNKMNYNNMNNNNTKYNEYNNMENNNDNITSRQSLMYPSFDELNDD